MANGNQNQSLNDRSIDDIDESIGGHPIEGTESVATPIEGRSSGANRGSSGLAERLTEILAEDGDGDLLLQRSDRDYSVLQWLQALDMQVMGACRADERLKPLLKMNVSTGAAEDCLLAYLSQHFDPAEVGMLARCLCIPLVSVRVGKIKKQGTLLCPTSIRGNLTLSLLPTSDLRISFIGDDGSTDRVATLSSIVECCAVEIEGIPADQSGRSFMIKIPGGLNFYFWCSEKSKLLGDEMLRKMKDLLKKKSSLAELSGICESRLKRFAIHVRAQLVGSTTPAFDSSIDSSSSDHNPYPSTSNQKPMRARHHGGLNARSSSFKDSVFRNAPSLLRNSAREKLRRRGDVASVVQSSNTKDPSCFEEKPIEDAMFPLLDPTNLLVSLTADLPFMGPASTLPSLDSSTLAYCWCPPVSALQYSAVTPHLPFLSTEALSLPPISCLSTQKQPLNLANVSSLDLPPLLPDPLLRLPLALPMSQQIPAFTPLMCDPIVHIPFIDVCSSGQGYLVSAGLSMPTAISPLHPEAAESVVEKSARETLHLLMNSSNQFNAPLMSVLPSFLPTSDEKRGVLAAGSRGLYSGTLDTSEIGERFVFEHKKETPSTLDGSVYDDDISSSENGKSE